MAQKSFHPQNLPATLVEKKPCRPKLLLAYTSKLQSIIVTLLPCKLPRLPALLRPLLLHLHLPLTLNDVFCLKKRICPMHRESVQVGTCDKPRKLWRSFCVKAPNNQKNNDQSCWEGYFLGECFLLLFWLFIASL